MGIPNTSGQFPAWALTLGAMIDHGTEVIAWCSKCQKTKPVDVAALAEKVGRDYSLIDRRCLCRLTAGCRGWNRFLYLQATYRPLWSVERGNLWMLRRDG